jgi:microcystin-dependent protein
MGLEAATYLASLVTTNPVGSTDAKSQGDDHLRLIKSTLKNSFPNIDKPTYLQQAVATVTSATVSADLPAATSDYLTISGTTTITSFGTMAAGHRKKIVFSGALILTHHSTSLILPSGANITTVAGDTCEAVSLGSGNWRILNYVRASGKAIVPPAMSEISSLFNSLLSSFVGVVFEWPGELADIPTGFLSLDGRAISRTTYSALFDLWGTTYGTGDGTTTFNIPDDRGYVIAGMDNMGTAEGAAGVITNAAADTLGGTMGEELHTMTAAELVAHTHNFTASRSDGNVQSGGGENVGNPVSTGATTSAGSTTPFNVVQPTQFRHKMVWTGVI